ncbi:MFS transporter [Ammoniphilus sp. CFH 90114]|uniref:MFS transporter n=1 Tax=Ammoniphilus sp. CFH 90114 TaxID=2493665 RepID=UPI00100E4F64|nr:MFS transporter [Ammoniphilus sp. CFH 90114]RXT05709.1 MFS transporter [Ammoniphilus sp. CFH 90114]
MRRSFKDPQGELYRFYILILAVAVAGLSQGLTLPLLSIMIEKAGHSSILNGWNAAALYIGMFVASFFVEKPLRRFGYKPMILFGIIVVLISSLLIPLWHNLIWWFVLRFLIGAGDSALHYASQLWITSTSAEARRGRNISLYGFAYGAGFSVGPFGVNLLPINVWLPFLLVALFYILAFVLVLRVTNEFPEQVAKEEKVSYRRAISLGWYALIPAFLYGYMEAVMNGSFPVYALRTGISEGWVSVLLFSFAGGALLTQLPLGIWSDRVGRKKVLMIAGAIGAVGFTSIPLAGDKVGLILFIFAVTGCSIGSFFSLGLAYLADLLPKHMLPSANVLAAMLFSIGSIIGPAMSGMGIQYIHPNSLFFFLGFVFAGFFLLGFKAKHSYQAEQQQPESVS